MHKIKKYANRKLYDTTDKRYISMDQLAKLIKADEDVQIIDNQSGEDITATVISPLLARQKKGQDDEVPSSLLFQLIRKGRGTLTDYARKYSSLWQSALSLAEDETDKLVNRLVKDKEISESEGSRLKKELSGYTKNLKKWISDSVDQRVREVLSMMNLASKNQIVGLTDEIKTLNRKVAKLEKLIAEKEKQKSSEASAPAAKTKQNSTSKPSVKKNTGKSAANAQPTAPVPPKEDAPAEKVSEASKNAG